MAQLSIENGTIVTFDADDTIIERGFIVADDGRIAAVGPGRPDVTAEEVIDAAGCVVIPGFVNAHTHLAMTLMRGFADDMRVREWLEQKIWPTEERLQPGDVYWGAMLGIAEMLRSGTTCFNDMYWAFEETTRAALEAGIRARPSGVLIGMLPRAEDDLKKAIEFVREYKSAGDGRIIPMFGPHAPYTCPDHMLTKVLDAARELDVGIHIHVSETRDEVQGSLAEHGKTPAQRLRDLGIFDVHVLAPHVVYPTDEDVSILADHGVGVAHCPGSNMKLASGIAPVPRMRERGVTVGIGTDGACSNNNLDMLEEVRLAALLHKVNSDDPTVINAYEALAMGTRESARALGIFDRVGSLEPGKRADIVIFDLRAPHLNPVHNPVSQIVYAARASDVKATIVDGQVLMLDGRLTTLDEEEVVSKANERADRLINA